MCAVVSGGPAALELCGVSKSYGSAVALHPLDLEVQAGRTTVLIGPSGCGKSTLLRLMVGLIAPTTGSILFGGEPIAPRSVLSIRQRIGYVIQDGGLFPHLTAAQNALLMSRHLRRPAAQADARLRELCELTRFAPDLLSRYPAELSGGQRQRVSLIRALMLQPEVLLLDEPLAALDPMVRAGLQTDLKAVFQHLHQAVVFVTHDMGEAGYLGDTIVLMAAGRIVQQGTLADLRERPADGFVKEFLNAQRSLVQL